MLLLPAALFVRMALNAIDGMMAREHDQKSPLGAILNELGDVVSDAALYLPLALVPGVEPLLLVPAVVLAVVSEMTGVLAIQIGAERRYDGPMGKSDRAFVFGLVGLLLGLGVPTGRWLDVVLVVVLALLVAHRGQPGQARPGGGRRVIDNLHPTVAWSLGAIFGVLVLATIIVAILKWRRPGKGTDELGLRIRSWWVMATVFTLALILSRKISLAFFAFLSFLALKEYLSLIPTRRADRRVLLWAYLAIPLQYWWIAIGWYGMFIIFIPVYMFLLLPLQMVLVGDTRGFLKAVGTLHWGLMMTVFAISHVACLLALPEGTNPVGGGAALVLFLVVLTEFNDVAQFIWGKLLGKRTAVPTVSPNKTVGGFVGGALTTVGLAFVAGAVADAVRPPRGAGGRPDPRGGRLSRRRDHLGGQARPGGQGQRRAAARPRRRARPDRQPDLHGAAVLPLRALLPLGAGVDVTALLKHLFFSLVVRPIVLVLLGLNVRRRELLPGDGPAILVANHNSHLDTMVLMTLLPARLLPRVRPVAAADYFLRNRLMAWFSLNVIGILPVSRKGRERRAPTRWPRRNAALDRREVVILFPEGTRGEPESLAGLKTGVAHLALAHPEAPLVPVFLHGLGKSLPKGGFLPVPFFCDVFVGEPLYGGDERWGGDAHRLRDGLETSLHALAEEGSFPEWT